MQTPFDSGSSEYCAEYGLRPTPRTTSPHTAVTPTTTTQLDAKALRNLRLLDPNASSGLLRRVLDTYLSSLGRLLGQLDVAETRGDAAGIRLVTHTLKSSSASIGALTLSQLCGAAEMAVREAQVETLGGLLAQLRQEAEQVMFAVHDVLAD